MFMINQELSPWPDTSTDFVYFQGGCHKFEYIQSYVLVLTEAIANYYTVPDI
jgi:hypothetical protein